MHGFAMKDTNSSQLYITKQQAEGAPIAATKNY